MAFKDLEVVYRKISSLSPYELNPKEHTETQIENIAKSIERYGWRSPILVNLNNGEIIAGHGRILAAKRLGLERVPCIDGSDLSEAQIKEYRYLDNKLNESEWDVEIMSMEFGDLDFSDFDLDWDVPGLLFDEDFGDDEDEQIPETQGNSDVEFVPSVAKIGDVWQLGEHILICGTSITSRDLMRYEREGRACYCIETDPRFVDATILQWEKATGNKAELIMESEPETEENE